MNPHRFRLAIFLALLLPACVALAAGETAPQRVRPGDKLAVAFHIATGDAVSTYTVEAGDELYLNFRYSPELSQIYIKQTDEKDQREEKWSDKVSILSRAFLVQPDGTIALNAIKEPMPVKGLTALQIAARAEEIYRKSGILRIPDLTVTVDPKYKKYDAFSRTVASAGERPIIYLPVPADGKISLPLVAGVSVAGRTVREVGDELTMQYREKGLPLVSVSVWFHEIGGGKQGGLRVLGEVKSPGVYPAGGAADLWDAIALAGGFTSAADVNKVRVTGRDGKTALGPFSFDEYLNTGNLKADTSLQGDELIFVPRMK